MNNTELKDNYKVKMLIIIQVSTISTSLAEMVETLLYALCEKCY